MSSDIIEIVEGKTKIRVPNRSLTDKVPPTEPAFFNPRAKLNRDFSIIAYSAFWKKFDKPKIFLDGLTGVGARALRVATEIDNVEKIVLNDINSHGLNLAKESFTLNKFEDLILRISERGDVQELSLDDLRLLSRAEMKSQNFDSANTLEKIAAKTQDDDDWYEVARVHFNKKRYDQALIAINEVLRISPINEKGLQLKIRTLMILDRDLEAVGVLKQLKNTVGMDSNLLLKEAALNFKIGKFSEAEMSYRTVWDEQNDISAARGIIRCLIREERFGATISFIDSIGITLDENIVVNKLHCLYKLQQFEQVMIVYESNKDLIQKNPKILRFAAMAQKSMGFLEEALSLWHKLLDFDAERLTANLAISGIAYDLHDNEKALFFLLKVLDEDPTNESALWLNSQIDIREKNWDGAISTLTQLKLEYPTNIKYWRSHISILYRINHKELAEEIFRDAVEKFGNELEYKTQLIESHGHLVMFLIFSQLV